MKDIFISYRREDGYLFAQLLYDHLQAKGFSAFYDREGLRVGEHFPQVLEDAIIECNDFIAICSESYLGVNKQGHRRIFDKGDWVHEEIIKAMNFGKNIIPIALDNAKVYDKTKLPDDICMLSELNFERFTNESNLSSFISYITEMFSIITRKNSKERALLNLLLAAGDETNPEFNINLRRIVMKYSKEDIDQSLIPIIESEDYELNLRFSAYYAAFIHYRRYDQPTLLYNLVENFSEVFNEFSFNNIVLSQYFRNKFLDSEEKSASIVNAIKYAQQSVDTIENNSGVLHNYAELIAVALESGYSQFLSELPKAIECINKAMKLNVNYPKQYCTFGRLISWKGDYDTALLNIRKAIDLEKRDDKDSLLRISQYNNFIIDIKMRQNYNKLVNQYKKHGDIIARILAITAITISLILLGLVLLRM